MTMQHTRSGIVSYDEMCRAISLCHSSDDAKSIRDQAEAIRVYALQAKNIEAERQAAEIRIRAERRWGQIYREAEKAKGAKEPGTKRGKVTRSPGTTASLEDLGVSKNQSSRWQKFAESSDKQFETALNKAGSMGVPTSAGVMRNLGVTIDHDEPPSDPKAAQALWVWGRVNQFIETTETLTPKQCAKRCDEVMTGDLRAQLPRLIKGLKELHAELK